MNIAYNIVKSGLTKKALFLKNDEYIAPGLGALIGGGIGAFTGKGWNSKLMRGLAGAGIGGGIGMGVNWFRDRLGKSDAAKFVEKYYSGLNESYKDIWDDLYTQNKNISESYSNLGGNEHNLSAEEKARAISNCIQTGKNVYIKPLFKDYNTGNPNPRKLYHIYPYKPGTKAQYKILTNPKFRDYALSDDFSRSLKYSIIDTDDLGPLTAKNIDNYAKRFKEYIEEPYTPDRVLSLRPISENPTYDKNPSFEFDYEKPTENYSLFSNIKPFYSSDLVAPLISSIIGGSIGGYTGKSKKQKLRRIILGALLGGGVGTGINWIKDRYGNSTWSNALSNEAEKVDNKISKAMNDTSMLQYSIKNINALLNLRNNEVFSTKIPDRFNDSSGDSIRKFTENLIKGDEKYEFDTRERPVLPGVATVMFPNTLMDILKDDLEAIYKENSSNFNFERSALEKRYINNKLGKEDYQKELTKLEKRRNESYWNKAHARMLEYLEKNFGKEDPLFVERYKKLLQEWNGLISTISEESKPTLQMPYKYNSNEFIDYK